MMRPTSRPTAASRRGSVLVLVLVIVAALSFSVFSFSERMLSEYEATRASVGQVQLRAAAISGVELTRTRLQANRTSSETDWTALVDGRDERVIRVSILRPEDSTGSGEQTGLLNESARLNINSLPLKPSKHRESQDRLLKLPGMTPDLASALLAWMSHSDSAEAGPRSDDPDEPPRRRFSRLDELLQVTGMTSSLLYGEDRNANGVRDFDESAGDRDGGFPGGLSEFLTVDGAESALRQDGHRRVNLNDSNLTRLYDQLAAIVPETTAQFIVACRIAPVEYPNARAGHRDAESDRLKRLDSAQRRLQSQLGGGSQAIAGSSSSERGGIVLPDRAPFRIESVESLVGARVQIRVRGEDKVLTSPWNDDANGFDQAYRQLGSLVTTTGESWLEGRINIHDASLPVLKTVPGMSESLARSLIARRKPNIRGYDTPAWMLREGLLLPAKLREIAPYITSGGDVWRGLSVGYDSLSNNTSAVAFVLAVQGDRSEIRSQHDLPFGVIPIHRVRGPHR
jgi:hypothetical protein